MSDSSDSGAPSDSGDLEASDVSGASSGSCGFGGDSEGVLSGEGSLRLDQQLCFAVYRAAHALNTSYRPILAPLALTYPQYLVMLVLWERRTATVKELGARLRLDSGTLSPLVKRLEAMGLVARRRRSTDERVVEVSLTPRGAELRERASGIPHDLSCATGLDVATAVELREALTRLADRLTGVGGATPPKADPASP